MSELLAEIPFAVKLFMFFVAWFLVEAALSIGTGSDNLYTIRLLTAKRRWNKIFICRGCDLMYRHYQKILYKEKNEEDRCPHCEKYILYSTYNKEVVETKWTPHVKTAPKINFIDCVKVKLTVLKLRKIKKEMEEQKFFEEYNKIEVNFDWVKNLQREKEK